ncbi:MAG TPA: LysR family transcriptional regulator [Anaerolineales bacterium]|jgi:DNA-binding transcriptional LysR family regulator|nr:LysR family transcriptional regulator [Anaerolineales bacterium]
MLNVHQLNVFVIAAETLNFTQTAKRLHLTQSSVSQHIKSLENQLGVQLFERKGRSLEITDAGMVLLPMAREIVEDSIRAAEQMELLKNEIHGHLVVGCNTAPGKYILPILLAKFHQQYPLVRISCQVLPPRQVQEGMAEGEIHFTLSNIAESSSEGAEYMLYLEEPIELIVPLNHPWAERGEIDPVDLYEEQFISREKNSGTYQNVAKRLLDVGIDIDKLDTFLEMGTSEALALAVEQELGVGFVSKIILETICPRRVAVVKVRGLNVLQPIYLGRQTAFPATSAQAAFWDYVREAGEEIFDAVRDHSLQAINESLATIRVKA